jgi:hypothetical protein
MTKSIHPTHQTIHLGDIAIAVTLKGVKNVHLSVHPPDGRVTLVAPNTTSIEVIRAYAISKLPWIRKKQQQMLNQAREAPRQYIEHESHYVWGRRYLLTIIEKQAKPIVTIDHQRITLTIPPSSDTAKRAAVFHEWHKSLLHAIVPSLIAKWEPKLGVKVNKYFLQRMKTRWGSCTPQTGNIRLNTELVKKPQDLLEYVIVHELAHLLVPNHGDRFVAIIDQQYPHWREAHLELNELPLGAASM